MTILDIAATIRALWQTERDHREAELITSDKLTPLRCPACFVELGLPPGWQPPLCPNCKTATLKPQTRFQHG